MDLRIYTTLGHTFPLRVSELFLLKSLTYLTLHQLTLPVVFILTTSLWRRVDFYCKELTPYHNMRQGPTPAEQSILLDYIDPILPTSFWKAMKYRHWAVIASLTVYLMLKLCVSSPL